MGRIEIINLINKPADLKYIHGPAQRRKALSEVIKKNTHTYVIQGSNLRMPGGVVDYKEQINLSRKRLPKYNTNKRHFIKNLM